jgi:hypothetical protein
LTLQIPFHLERIAEMLQLLSFRATLDYFLSPATSRRQAILFRKSFFPSFSPVGQLLIVLLLNVSLLSSTPESGKIYIAKKHIEINKKKSSLFSFFVIYFVKEFLGK